MYTYFLSLGQARFKKFMTIMDSMTDEVRRPKTETRNLKPEIPNPKTENQNPKPETEIRKMKSEIRKLKTEIRKQEELARYHGEMGKKVHTPYRVDSLIKECPPLGPL